MAENPAQAGQQQLQMQIDQSKMTTTYANMIFPSTTADEIVLDFGVAVPRQQNANQPPVLMCNIGGRVVMNWVSAKRLAITLGNIIRQYEEQRGEIQITRPQPGADGAPPQA